MIYNPYQQPSPGCKAAATNVTVACRLWSPLHGLHPTPELFIQIKTIVACFLESRLTSSYIISCMPGRYEAVMFVTVTPVV